MTLTLVRPSTEGQDGGRVRRRRTPHARLAPKFTPAQLTRIRAVIRNLRAAYGSYSCLAEVTGIAKNSLSSVASDPTRATLGFVHRLARAAGMTVDALLTAGLVPIPDVCPTCGRKGGA